MRHIELLNELNGSEIKIKTAQKRFSVCHRGQSLPSLLYIVKSKFCLNIIKLNIIIWKKMACRFQKRQPFWLPYIRFKSYGPKYVFNKNAQKLHIKLVSKKKKRKKERKDLNLNKIKNQLCTFCGEFIKNLYRTDFPYLQNLACFFSFDTKGNRVFNSIFRDPWKLWYNKK